MQLTRPGPPHAAFLTRSDADPSTTEAVWGRAAFLVLRVVDALDTPDFHAQWVAADEYIRELGPDSEDEAMYLRGILDSVLQLHQRRDAFTLDTLDTGLSTYSINRRDREYHDEAIDLLETAWRVMRGDPGELWAATRLGEELVHAGRLADATRLYGRIARSGLRDARLIAREGQADVLLAAGEPRKAEFLYRRLLPDARRAEYEAVALHAEVGIARALLHQGRARDAALAAWQLMHRDDHYAHLLLGPALEAVGALDAAARIQAGTTLGCPQLDPRWRAVASLVRIATRQNDRLAFERWRKVGEHNHEQRLPPVSAELDFWLELARGAAWFDAAELLSRALDTARALAECASAADAKSRYQAAELDVRARRPPPPVPSLPLDAELEPVLTWTATHAVPSTWASLVARESR